MSNEFLGMLGLCRKAGKFSGGHDAAFESIKRNKAAACFLTKDASERLKNEFYRTTSFEGRKIPCIEMHYTMNDIYAATNLKSAVFTVNDDGFAKKLTELLLKED